MPREHEQGFYIQEDKLPYDQDDAKNAYVIYIDWSKSSMPEKQDKFTVICNPGYEPILLIGNDRYIALPVKKLLPDTDKMDVQKLPKSSFPGRPVRDDTVIEIREALKMTAETKGEQDTEVLVLNPNTHKFEPAEKTPVNNKWLIPPTDPGAIGRPKKCLK